MNNQQDKKKGKATSGKSERRTPPRSHTQRRSEASERPERRTSASSDGDDNQTRVYRKSSIRSVGQRARTGRPSGERPHSDNVRSERRERPEERRPRTDRPRPPYSRPERDEHTTGNSVRSERRERTEERRPRTERAQSRSDRPHSKSDRPQSRSEHPQSSLDRPQSRSEHPQSSSDRPQSRSERPHSRPDRPQSRSERPASRADRPQSNRSTTARPRPETRRRPSYKPKGGTGESYKPVHEENQPLRLNKFIAHAGVCSRREADEYISAGKVRLNGAVCRELGIMVSPDDRVEVDGQQIKLEPFIYLLMNKPRDTITTTSDEKGRQTVMDLIEDATGLRLYPVGRLDRNTTGLILLTNDGDLANRLMHPSYKVRKVYEVQTSRLLTDEELLQLRLGVDLDDGPAKAYRVARHPAEPNTVILNMHEGRNRIVRRMMEAIGVDVVKLVRTIYGPLQIKGLRTGRWRSLKPREVNELRKMVKLLTLEFAERTNEKRSRRRSPDNHQGGRNRYQGGHKRTSGAARGTQKRSKNRRGTRS